MDIETAKAMLALLLGKHWPLFSSFHHFLEVLYCLNCTHIEYRPRLTNGCIMVVFCSQQSKYKVINKDQWCNVLEFSRLIHPDLSNYEEDGACELYEYYI